MIIKCGEDNCNGFMKSVYHTPGEKKTEGKPLLFYGSTALWQGRQDSNLRHPVLETGALPTELLPYADGGIIP